MSVAVSEQCSNITTFVVEIGMGGHSLVIYLDPGKGKSTREVMLTNRRPTTPSTQEHLHPVYGGRIFFRNVKSIAQFNKLPSPKNRVKVNLESPLNLQLIIVYQSVNN